MAIKTYKEPEEILRNGMVMLPVKEKAIEDTLQNILLKTTQTEKRIVFPVGLRQWVPLAAAACLILSAILFWQHYRQPTAIPTSDRVVSKQNAIKETALFASVLDLQGNATVSKAQRLHSGDSIIMGLESQAMLKAGLRTRIILGPETRVRLSDMDSLGTELVLYQGKAAFEVEPGGGNTVRIKTNMATFRVIGTLFTIDVVNKVTTLSVLRGKVEVKTNDNLIQRVSEGQCWTSSSPSDIQILKKASSEFQIISDIFFKNQLIRIPWWHSKISEPRLPEKSFSANLEILIKLIDQGAYTEMKQYLSVHSDQALKDSVSARLFSRAGMKAELLQFVPAEAAYQAIIDLFPSTLYHETALLRLFKMAQQYHKPLDKQYHIMAEYMTLFPTGQYAEEMTDAAIPLYRELGKAQEAYEQAEKYKTRFTQSTEREQYIYLCAKLMEQYLKNPGQSLLDYQFYMAEFPKGRYAEDALYSLCRLAKKMNDLTLLKDYTHAYFSNFPSGRWKVEVESLATHGR